MMFVKWIAIVLVAGYLAGLALLYVKQRGMLFPIPTADRTAPDAAGLPEAEEHVLTTSDGEKVIVWHVPARPGRPVILYFPGNGDYRRSRQPLQGHDGGRHRPRRPVLSRLCRLERGAERGGPAAGRRGRPRPPPRPPR